MGGRGGILMKRFWTVVALTVILVSALFASMSDVKNASKNLQSIQCYVRAENHAGSRKAVVEFWFYYERNGKKMRIEYTYPKNMKGSIIAIDGKNFYSYIPSLNKKIKKPLGQNTKNPGKDMGLLYNFVLGDFYEVIEKSKVNFIGQENVKVLGKTVKAFHYKVKTSDNVQEIWFDEKTLFPIKIEIYVKGKLRVVLQVSQIAVNPKFEEKIFQPF